MEFINKFKNYLLEPKKEGLSQKNVASKATVKNYLADINHFISWIEATYKKPFTPAEVTIQIINQFKQEKSANLSASSVDRHISSLRKFFAFLKADGDITSTPFDLPATSLKPEEDPWHIHDFKNYLYTSKASHLTIKNYLIDVKQFLAWAEEVLRTQDAWTVSEKDILKRIDNRLVEEYKQRLLQQNVFSATSINRKLSSLRKYLSWAGQQGHMADNSMLNAQYPVANVHSYESSVREGMTEVEGPAHAQVRIRTEHLREETTGRTPTNLDKQGAGSNYPINSAQSQRHYSKIPPVRLFQKLTNAGTFAFDLLISRPIAQGFKTSQHHAWVLKGKPLFVPTAHLLTKRIKRFTPTIKNVSKELYAPLSISTKDFPWYKKIIFHARYTRPQWYRKYHQLAVVHYFNWAVLIIFSAGIGFGMYNSFFQRPNPSLAALPTAGTRVLSFQGRLTDANDNPITTPSWIRFIIYNDTSASGSARLWEEVQKVSPDQDGIFSLYLGSNGSGGTAAACNSGNPPTSPATGACGIPQSLFAQNSALWLGVTVEATAELAPREQIATVAYAVNSETLQGLPPITQSGAGTQNVVLALNSSGNLAIGGSTIFQATSGDFTLSGNTLVLNTNAGTNGGITLSPDGIGAIDVQKPLQNSTNNNNITSAKGAVEIDDLAAILATSSGQSALTIDQNGTGPIISASHSGTAEFTLDNSGNGTFNGNVTGQTIYTGGGTSYYINNTTSNLNSLTLAGSLAVSGNVASDLTPSVSDTYSLGSASKEWLNLYAQNIYSNGQLLSQLWHENQGVLSPIHTQDDLALGGTATSDAKFQVFGTTGNATTSGTLTFNTTGTIQTTKNQEFILGGNSTGNIFLSPQNGSGLVTVNGNLTVNGTTQNVGNGSAYTIQTSSNAGLNLLSAGTGNITLGQNLGNGTVLLQPNAGGQAALIINKQTTGLAVVGDLLTASNSATTEFQVTNGGNVIGRKFTDLDNTNYFLDPAGVANALIIAGTEGIGTTNPLSQSGLDIEKDAQGNAAQVVNQQNTVGPIFTASSSGTTRFTIQNDGTLIATKYTTNKGLLYINDTTGTLAQTAQGAANTVLHGNGTSAPTFSAVDLTADVTGTLPINKGGTNATSIGANGAIAYSDGSKYVFTSSVGSLGNCLVSNGGGAPSWGSCGGSGGGYWTLDSTKGTIYPINTTLDLFVGGTATSSAEFAVTGIATGTPTASVSATAAGTGVAIKGDGSIQSLINAPLTIGGNTTGNIILSPLNGSGDVTIKGSALQTTFSSFDLLTSTNTLNIGGAASTTNFKSNAIDSTQSTLTLFATPTSVTLGGAATTLNLGAATGTTTVKNDLSVAGNTTLGTSTSNTVTVNGLVNSSILPSSTSDDLGSPAHYWGTVYAQNFVAPVAGGISGFWQLTSSVLSPVNSWNDLAVGGNATGSAKFQIFATPYTTDAGTGNAKTVVAGTATTSGNLTFTGTSSVVNLLNGTGLTIKGSGGGDSALASLVTISNAGDLTLNGDLAVNGGDITTTASTANIFSSNASSINIGGNSSTTNFKGNLTLGTSISNTITFNGLVNSSILPSGGLDIGSLNNRWGSIYASNLYLPVAGGTGGYWTLASSVLSPTNNWNDLAVGGTATSSATAFQVFANAYANNAGTVPAGTATTSGNLIFRGTPTSQTPFAIDLLNGSSLSIKRSVGGDNGLSTIATFGNDGNITDTGNLAVNGSQITSTTGTFSLLNTGVTNLSFAGAATTLSIGNSGGTATFNGALAVTGTTNLNGNITLGDASSDQITVNGRYVSSLIPNAADTYNLGSVSNEWDTLYVRQIVTPSNGGLAGFWQLSNQGVLAPANITNDLAVGGTATSSATPFQVFATAYTNDLGTVPAGTATTSGNLTFRGTAGSQTAFQTNILNGASLGFYTSAGGDKGINTSNPSLFIAANGNVGIGTTNPTSALTIYSNGTAALIGDGTNTSSLINLSGSRALVGYDGSNANLQSSGGHGIKLNVGSTTFGSGTTALFANGNVGNIGVGATTNLGNAQLVVNQTNTSGLGDIFTASTSGTTKFVITNDGSVGIGNLSDATILPQTGLHVEKNGLGNTLALFNQLGNGDIISASASGTQQFTVNNTGNVYGRKFTDIDNTIYYLDPAGLSVSASVAGSMTFTPASEHDINFLNNSDLNFQSSPGGDAGLTSRLFVQGTSGNVGIGTISPDVRLEIASKSANTEIIGSPHNAAIEIKNTNSSAFNEKAELQFTVGNNITPNAAITALYTDWSSPGGSAGLTGADLAFSTKTATGLLSERMRIDKNGNVGIGTSSPDTALTLESVGDYSSGSNYTFDIDSGGTKMFNIGVNTSAAGSGGGAYINSLASRPLLLNASGSNNVGIGTSNPVGSFNLAINGATSALSSSTLANRGMVITANATGRDRLYFENTAATSGQRVFMIDNGNTSGILSFNSLNDAGSAFVTQNIFNIKYNGNVGIGTTNPGSPLDISGGSTDKLLQMESSNTGQTYIDINNTTGHEFQLASGGSTNTLASGFYIYDVTAAARRLNIDSSGNMGVNTTTMTEMFNVNGRVAANGYRTRTGTAGSFGGNNFNINWTAGGCFNFWVDTTNEGQAGTTCPSDQRLKTDVQPIGNALSQINQLTPITFNWKQGTDNGTDLQTGFLAQDVMKIFPELVDHTDQITPWTPDGMYRLNYVGLIAPAIRAIQEISATQSAHTTDLANLTLNTTGDIAITQATPSADFTVPHYYTLSGALDKPISQMGAFLELAVGNLRAGSVNAQQVITNSLAITTANVTVAGQSLHDYIASVVNEVVSQNNQANSTQSNSVKTNLISPLSGDGIAIRLKNSKIEIAKDASSSAVASIDNNGNATFSGTLNSQNLAVNGDATVSGTLHADRIEANSITGLEAIVSTLSAQNVTIVNNIYNATPSATPTTAYIATGLDNSSSPSSSLLADNGFTDIASFSGFLSYVPSLKATTGLFEQGLVSLGGTSLADTSITGQLSINSRLILADTSINVLGGDLQIQPLRQGGVNFLAGAMTIDTNGNLTVNGNSVFNGNLAVNTISPLAGKDLNVKLGDTNSTNPKLNIQNASGSAVFAVNQLGDVVASGAATVGKLNLSLVQPALAVSDTEVVATGSAGTTAIKPHQKEITIDNPNVTAQSLIYITPVGTDQIPYLERQISGKSFTVGIPIGTPNAVNFNWLIVN